MNIIGRRKIWYAISLLIIIPGIISLLLRGLNLGIDFTGGSLLQFQFENTVTVEQVRNVLDQSHLGSSTIQLSDGNNVFIRTKPMDEGERSKLVNDIKSQVGNLTVQRDEIVGPVIGKELAQKALLALAIASVLIIGYITVRFEFKFAIAAILALMHDVFVVVGIFSIFQIEVDSSFVAAVLTVVGYSINDTIVIFDRIRENLNRKKRTEDLESLVNRSVLETMTRSINTVLQVVFVLVALLFWGGETTKVFTLAMLVGVVSGAYSSIFNASPLWFDFKQLEKAQRSKNRAKTA
ncbi:protein translocase subunit SecF [Heliobacterium chlorum]|uniref:Protein-export membrane protein SecF n=1 Tax=Heliobacterium chlorum TaxID=2698 RepID=A0ABR7T4R4_HELCL|nr:protein translocase subunit SecF [Heliobacterium chlorum]MBC9785656.1 protein translocase subunit SecF [Heliobacterium chlorum]